MKGLINVLNVGTGDTSEEGAVMTTLPNEENVMDGPRRKIVMTAKFEADSWEYLRATFISLERELARDGELSRQSVSGGYSSGWIYVCDVDGSMTHDRWASELNAHLEKLERPETQ